MLEWVEGALHSAQGSDEIPTTEGHPESTRSCAWTIYTDGEGRTFQTVFLIAVREQRPELAAVLVLHAPPHVHSMPSRTLLQELARELLEHGDVDGVLAAS
jgi:hypothetical protein